jgi:predicted nuclease of predicted toxin-antitoxin system
MKFLVDVCVSSRSLLSFLTDAGHEVVTMMDIDPSASDTIVLETAFREQRVLVTADNDFGELVFVRRMPHGPIVRLVELNVDDQVQGMRELLERNAAELEGAVLITVTRWRIRVRR